MYYAKEGRRRVLSSVYRGQFVNDVYHGFGVYTRYNDRREAIEVHVGNWKTGNQHVRNVLSAPRAGAWMDYPWVEGTFANDTRDIKWRFMDGTVYEGKFRYVSKYEREGNGLLYDAGGEVHVGYVAATFFLTHMFTCTRLHAPVLPL